MLNELEANYHLFLESIEILQNALATSFYDAFLESSGYLIEGKIGSVDGTITPKDALRLEEIYAQIAVENMPAESRLKMLELALLKGMQMEPLQANHQMTASSVNFIMAFLIKTLQKKENFSLLDIGVGSGNLLLNVLNDFESPKVMATGIDNDDLLIDIAATSGKLLQQEATFIYADAVSYDFEQQYDVVMGDFPIGYYPIDEVSKEFSVYEPTEKTYAHHLLLEKSMQQVAEGGYGIFLLPSNLLSTPQASNLIKFMKEKVYLQAVIELPEKIFQSKSMKKSIYIFQNQSATTKQEKVFAHLIENFKDRESILKFRKNFVKWAQN